MDKLEQIKQKIQEYQNKSAVTQDLKAFLTLVLTYIKTAKEEFSSLSSEQLGTIKEAVDYIETQKKVLLEDVTHETQIKTDEMKSLIAEVKDFLVEVKKIKATPGKDAEPVDYERIIGSVLEQIPVPEIPEMPELEEKTPDELVKDINKSTTLILKDKVEGLLDIERMAKMNAPGGSSTTFVNGKLAKNINFTGATITHNGDNANITITGGSGGTWGSITGTLSDQADLQSALDAKAPTTSPTFATSITGSYLTASEILITDASKNIVSAPVATYPSLTELTYVKGVTSAIQTQLNAKQASDAGLTSLAGLTYASTSFVKMTGADTFALDTNTYLTTTDAGTTYVPYTGATGGVDLGANSITAGDFFVGSSAGMNDGATIDFYSDTGMTQTGGFFVASANQYSLFNVTSSLSAILDVSAIATADKTITVPNRSLTLDNITTSTTTNGTGFLKGNGSVISFDNTTYANVAGALTQFVGNTAWRVFYSDGSGDIQELALGADGTFLKSNGAAVAPSFATPTGSGDVSKVGTPANTQLSVWTGDGTLAAITQLTFTGGNSLNFTTEGDSLSITGIDATTLNTAGAGINLQTGAGNGTASGGDIQLLIGEAGATGTGGGIYIIAGLGGATSGNGGVINLYGGDAQLGDSNGGDVVIAGGALSGGGTEGKIKLLHQTNGLGAILDVSSIATSDKTFTFPNSTGTLMLTSAIGTTVQAYDADLTTWAGITPGTGVGTALAVNVGSAGAFVVNGGALGTPSSGTGTNITGIPTANILAGSFIAGAFDFGGSTSLEIPNGAGGTTVDAAGEICVDTTSKTVNFYDGAAEKVLTPVMSKSITIESPTSSEDLSMFYTDDAITVTKIVFVITGSTSATTTIRHSTDRSAAGNEVVTGGTVANSTTTGNVVTSFNDATIPADSFVWLETTALSGTPTSLNVTIFYTQDA